MELPVNVLYHKFLIYSKKAHRFFACATQKVRFSATKCKEPLINHCPMRAVYGPSWQRCRQVLNEINDTDVEKSKGLLPYVDGKAIKDANLLNELGLFTRIKSSNSSENIISLKNFNFEEYFAKNNYKPMVSLTTAAWFNKLCLNSLFKKLNPCIAKTEKVCNGSKIRAVKIFRTILSTLKPLLEQNNGVKIIHLIRDPRATLFSRISVQRYSIGRGQGNILLDAKILCNRMVENFKVHQELAKRYVVKIMHLMFYKKKIN